MPYGSTVLPATRQRWHFRLRPSKAGTRNLSSILTLFGLLFLSLGYWHRVDQRPLQLRSFGAIQVCFYLLLLLSIVSNIHSDAILVGVGQCVDALELVAAAAGCLDHEFDAGWWDLIHEGHAAATAGDRYWDLKHCFTSSRPERRFQVVHCTRPHKANIYVSTGRC